MENNVELLKCVLAKIHPDSTPEVYVREIPFLGDKGVFAVTVVQIF